MATPRKRRSAPRPAAAEGASPAGGWLPSEHDRQEWNGPRRLGAALTWRGVACTAHCSNFRLLVSPITADGAAGGAGEQLDLPWMRAWSLNIRGVTAPVDPGENTVIVLTKSGESHRLRAESDEHATNLHAWLDQRMEHARRTSAIGALESFGSRLGQRFEDRPAGASDPRPDARALVAEDYGRLGLAGSADFRAYCHEEGAPGPALVSYPNVVFVPKSFNNNQMQRSADFRGVSKLGKGRMPAVCWRHPGTGVVIVRSAQPKPGIRGHRCVEDEALLRQIAEAARAPHADPSQGLMIFDARSLLAATGNNLKGGGYEDCTPGGGYSTCDIEFLNIGNIHLMRRALQALSVELAHTHTDTTGGESGYVASSGAGRSWLDFQAQILDGAAQIRNVVVNKGRSVLVHCSDGWDRTSQLTATAEILLDGYYRTIDGFVALVQREWLDFGHMFSKRLHQHGDPADYNAGGDEDEEDEAVEFSPIFLQWVETVWQLLVQFPDAFEFKESLLLETLDAAYSCQYTTFLGDNETQRRRHLRQLQRSEDSAVVQNVEEEVCFWHERILSVAGRRRHENQLYTRGGGGAGGLLIPSVASCKLRLWDELHMSDQQPHLRPRVKPWPDAPQRSLGGGAAAGGDAFDESVSSPRTAGVTELGEDDHRTSMDTSRIMVRDDFYGAEPEPELARNSSFASSVGSPVDLPRMDLPPCLAEDVRWVGDEESSVCTQCRATWSSTLRRHHCKLCGGLFCYACAPERPMQRTPAGADDPGGPKIRCCDPCTPVLDLGISTTHTSSEEFATALKKEWRSRLTLMQPTVTNTGGLARRPKNLGGAAPWLVAVLRGAAWGEDSAETLLNEMAEEVDARLEEDAIAAADAVAGRRVERPMIAAADTAMQVAASGAEAATDLVEGVQRSLSTLSAMFGRK